jgi:hypothetical protein
MFATEFTLTNNIYRLTVDTSIAIPTAAWLDRQGVTFDRLFCSEGYCELRFIVVPDKAIALISAKYPLPTEPVVAAVVAAPDQDWSGYEFVKAFDIDSIDNGFWITCPTPELAVKLATGLPVQTYLKVNQVHFADSDLESTMTPELLCDLIERFGEPSIYWNNHRGCPTYYFDNCHTSSEVKAKYRKLSKLHHPDLGGDSETFIAIANQYKSAMTSLS